MSKPQSPTNAHAVRAVLYQEKDWWAAQCLEYDVATQAKTLTDLYQELERVLLSHVAVSDHLGREPFVDLPPAPSRFEKMFKSARPVPPNGGPYFTPVGHLRPLIVSELRILE